MAETNVTIKQTDSSQKVKKFYVEEVVSYVDKLGKNRSFTRLIREDGWPFTLNDDGVILPTFNVRQDDIVGINLAIRTYFDETEQVSI